MMWFSAHVATQYQKFMFNECTRFVCLKVTHNKLLTSFAQQFHIFFLR